MTTRITAAKETSIVGASMGNVGSGCTAFCYGGKNREGVGYKNVFSIAAQFVQ